MKPKDIVDAYFEEIEILQDDGSTIKRLRCKGCVSGDEKSKSRTYSTGQVNGNQNLALHVKNKHPDYLAKVEQHKSGNIFLI
jgi:hypothetical protein